MTTEASDKEKTLESVSFVVFLKKRAAEARRRTPLLWAIIAYSLLSFVALGAFFLQGFAAEGAHFFSAFAFPPVWLWLVTCAFNLCIAKVLYSEGKQGYSHVSLGAFVFLNVLCIVVAYAAWLLAQAAVDF